MTGGNSMFSGNRQDECAEDAAEFEAKALPHLDKLFRVAAWLTQDRTGAETLVQETLTTALKSFRQLEVEADACVWLIRIMYQIKNEPRRAWWSWNNSSSTEVARVASGSVAEVIAHEPRTPQGLTEDEVLRAVKDLSPQNQEVILLVDIVELTYKETAEVLGITTGVLMLRLKRARKRLRAGLRARASEHGMTSNRKIANGFTSE